ncbi:MAG: YqgE/AlgH family protein [Myxococcota bacterium]|nr:YqgE/AlgH family protein [Myxococcota bacterium]
MASTPLAPSLLVALDTIVDPNFRRSVVFMLHHDAETGGLGLVVNRRTDFAMADLCENLELPWRGDPAAQVDWGGPVQPDQGWVLVGDRFAERDDVEHVMEGIYWSRSQEVLRELAERPGGRARVFLGYAGWAPGQLEREIADGSWLVVPPNERLLFEAEPEVLWTEAVRSLGVEPATLVATQGVN